MKELFDKHLLFRRGIVCVQLIIAVYITHISLSFAIFAVNAGVAPGGIVAIMTTIQAPSGALLAYTLKLYGDARRR